MGLSAVSCPSQGRPPPPRSLYPPRFLHSLSLSPSSSTAAHFRIAVRPSRWPRSELVTTQRPERTGERSGMPSHLVAGKIAATANMMIANMMIANMIIIVTDTHRGVFGCRTAQSVALPRPEHVHCSRRRWSLNSADCLCLTWPGRLILCALISI